MSTFSKGDTLRRTGKSMDGGAMVQGEEYTVDRVERDTIYFEGIGYGYSPENFELVHERPKWSDVEPGDKVTFRVQETGEEFTTTATVGASRRAAILGLRLGLGLPSNRWELLSVEKPKPQPPTTPGSHVTVPHPYWESGINHLFLLDSGKWASQTGRAFWPAEDVASKDFTVIHDAGAQS